MNFLRRTQSERPVYYCDCTLHPVMLFLISDTHSYIQSSHEKWPSPVMERDSH